MIPPSAAPAPGCGVAVPARPGFPASVRVRSRADYARVFDQGRRHAHPLLALHALPDPHGPRLGLAVSRKVSPSAVVRNRIKRVLRDAFRHRRAALAPLALVVVARPAAAQAQAAMLRAAFDGLLQRAGALPAPVPAGTMPPASRGDA